MGIQTYLIWLKQTLFGISGQRIDHAAVIYHIVVKYMLMHKASLAYKTNP